MSDPKCDDYHRGLASMVCLQVSDKKSSESGIINEPNYQLANELHKPIIQKLKKKVYSSSSGSIWGIDLADMKSLSKFNKGNNY